LLVLESGDLSFHFAGPATVIQAGAGAPAAQEEIALTAGDALLIPAGTGFAVRNDGAESAQVLGVVAFPAEEEMPAEGTPAAAEEEFAAGITFQPLAFGVASDLPAGPAVIGMGRITLEPGMSAPPEEPHPGPEIVLIETGTVAVTVTGGEAHVLRGAGMATPGAEPGAAEPATVGEEIVFETGDTLFAQTGSVETARNVGDAPATALVVFFAPAGAEHDETGTPVP
jgi:quercetin dioxygenase-like cupin family protein